MVAQISPQHPQPNDCMWSVSRNCSVTVQTRKKRSEHGITHYGFVCRDGAGNQSILPLEDLVPIPHIEDAIDLVQAAGDDPVALFAVLHALGEAFPEGSPLRRQVWAALGEEDRERLKTIAKQQEVKA